MSSDTCTVLNTNTIQNDDTHHQNEHQNDNEQNDNEDAIDSQHNNNDNTDDATNLKLSKTSDDHSASGSNSSDKSDDEETDKVHKKRTSRCDHTPNKKDTKRSQPGYNRYPRGGNSFRPRSNFPRSSGSCLWNNNNNCPFIGFNKRGGFQSTYPPKQPHAGDQTWASPRGTESDSEFISSPVNL
ncbi:unnamed protein product [Didymodactylos carnosus]|uniref:Uncharacterized protein n=1 Tax=Didymodactylos carnosus TaxID=1234261 RepID=A0A8S2VPP9_9BILA|nr:unnamed protein product [Didymodactylos carnosus]CAF4383600.1 unnamed protein product [Didymodactylos carnosus]